MQPRADLDADRIFDAAQVLQVRAIRIVGAQPDPRKMSEQVEVAGTPRNAAGLRRFVAQVQRFVGGEEIDLVGIAGAHAEHVLDELQRVLDGLHHAVVLVRERRVLDPVEIEVLGMVQVGEAAFDQRADEVERQGGALVAAQQELRIGPAGIRGELGAVDVVAAIGRQADAVAGFSLAERGLAYCPAKRPMRITGRRAPITSTSDICSRTFSVLVMRTGVQSTKRSAQSPAWRTNWRPSAASASCSRRRRISQLVTSGGSVRRFGQHPLDFGGVGVFGLL